MVEFLNRVYKGSAGRASLYDLVLPDHPKNLVIFMHGYKGFKDWGCWNLLMQEFVRAGMGFLKFNVSHNGGTVENPIDFPDPDAFGKNTYSYELNDLKIVVDLVTAELDRLGHPKVKLYLLGHSRGGGLCMLHGARDNRISGVISWAGISDIGSRFPKGSDLEQWRKNGVYFVRNTRTDQDLPHYFSFYEDYLQHAKELDIQTAARQIRKPLFLLHGSADTSVSLSEGRDLAAWSGRDLKILQNANHTFGSSHPWEMNELPEDLKKAFEATLGFVNGQNQD